VVSKNDERPIHLRSIGHVENAFSRSAPPEQIRAHESRLVLKEEFVEGLEGLHAGDRLTVLFHFHLSLGYDLLQHPRGDISRARRGVFTMCSPRRPNGIGTSFVELVAIQGSVLVVRGLDALDGSPLLDIKPFVVYDC
jgi:tRNA-Thr(GGU) m(6)t(6)A37 methyltransferase TsaA